MKKRIKFKFEAMQLFWAMYQKEHGKWKVKHRRKGRHCFKGRLENNYLKLDGNTFILLWFQDTDKAKMLAREQASDDNDKMVKKNANKPPPSPCKSATHIPF
jgi:hypothetical protein